MRATLANRGRRQSTGNLADELEKVPYLFRQDTNPPPDDGLAIGGLREVVPRHDSHSVGDEMALLKGANKRSPFVSGGRIPRVESAQFASKPIEDRHAILQCVLDECPRNLLFRALGQFHHLCDNFDALLKDLERVVSAAVGTESKNP